MKRASGEFDVKVLPQAPEEGCPEPGRMTLDKRFHGDLEATSRGQMLAIRGGVEGSAGYVAMERVSGALAGREGTFALQHIGTMERGKPGLSVTVVPDSGTGDLVGLSGKMEIIVEGGKHFYSFDYSFAAAG